MSQQNEDQNQRAPLVPVHPFRVVAEGTPYNSNENRLGEVNGRRYTCAPLMRPATIQRMFQDVGRRVKLYVPPFMDMLAPVHYHDDPNYIALVAGLMNIDTTGARGEYSTMLTVQACAVGYGQADCATLDEARVKISAGLKARFNLLSDRIRAELCAGQPIPVWLNTEDLIDDNTVAWVLEELAADPEQRSRTVAIFATAMLGYCKQGNVTTGVINKITTAAREELGLNIILDPQIIRNFWNIVRTWYTPDAARYFFSLWETAIGESCLRFRLLVQQASWSGMTNFVNIKRVRDEYPNFFWPQCVELFPRDFANFQLALDAVGDNQYYGYRFDLGAAKSTLYPDLCYVAYRLLIDCGGERDLNAFQGTNRRTPHASAIDRLVTAYDRVRSAGVEKAPSRASERVAINFVRHHRGGPAPQGGNPPSSPPDESDDDGDGGEGGGFAQLDIPPRQEPPLIPPRLGLGRGRGRGPIFNMGEAWDRRAEQARQEAEDYERRVEAAMIANVARGRAFRDLEEGENPGSGERDGPTE